MELIDREALLNFCPDFGKIETPKDGMMQLIKAIEDAPAVDAVPAVHGHWCGEHGDKCSNCHERTKWFYENFCPNCGARMDEAGQEE